MTLNDPESYFRYIRMSKERFDHLLNKIKPLIDRHHYDSSSLPKVSPAEKLAVTLGYLATGDSQVSISFNFRLGRSTVCLILNDTCNAIWDALNSIYLNAPSTEEKWIEISKGIESMWNISNCIGAIGGKRIVIQAPMNAGSAYFIDITPTGIGNRPRIL
ncbi:PREDICTED: uncharacterized protein LOC105314968 [Amphimedon queenslandica]|uniref:DDE Tnp4 domain-containing protein n=1 Tax=Amphimedon queenslandica TaxID=400682 RepID=A0AAN0IQX5_AMPQE|nr:PREDICTED: uncharacterized protein LOC105314968 [Amphimedon queenslandica]|eukprot:XP_011407736.1 PREDICTED: uncharacterized protein LOC105314968 [Amphimedon queenslandica]